MGNSQTARKETAFVDAGVNKKGIFTSHRHDTDAERRLWHLYGKAYDFTGFLDKHPGGKEALLCAQGLPDATALFESYHPTMKKPKAVLKKFERGKSTVVFKTPHEYKFEDKGFYNRLRERVVAAQVEAGYGDGYWKASAANQCFTLFHVLALVMMRYQLVRGQYAHFSLQLFALAVVNALFRGLMITRTAHSASHHAFSKYPIVNEVMYRVAMTLMGGSSEHWTNQHIVRHHIETNIIPIDYDTMYPVKRVLDTYRPLWFHRYQHIYMWFLYMHTMVAWTLGDIAYAFHPRVPLNLKAKSLSLSCAFMLHAWVLPFLVLPASTAAALVYTEVVVSSLFFSFQFVVNHEVTGTEGHSTNMDWGVYQILSSHDFGIAPGDKPTWAEMFYCHSSGGLNNQIAHHLYPSTHFSHYPRITRAIRSFCKEEGVPFQEASSLGVALRKHYMHLYEMGDDARTRSTKAAAKKLN